MFGGNELYHELLSAVESFCEEQRFQSSVSRRLRGHYPAAARLRETVHRALPELAQVFDSNLPTPIFAREVIGFAVKGLNDKCTSAIWEQFYLLGTTVNDIAPEVNYSPRTIWRRIRVFPQSVADQLWTLHLSFGKQREEAIFWPSTLKQRRKYLLQKKWALSDKGVEVLLMFMAHSPKVGRKAIAKALFISVNTLKKHIGKINRAMGTITANEAAEKAGRFLENCPEAEWSG